PAHALRQGLIEHDLHDVDDVAGDVGRAAVDSEVVAAIAAVGGPDAVVGLEYPQLHLATVEQARLAEQSAQGGLDSVDPPVGGRAGHKRVDRHGAHQAAPARALA